MSLLLLLLLFRCFTYAYKGDASNKSVFITIREMEMRT